jgi:predicted oxidoreductase
MGSLQLHRSGPRWLARPLVRRTIPRSVRTSRKLLPETPWRPTRAQVWPGCLPAHNLETDSEGQTRSSTHPPQRRPVNPATRIWRLAGADENAPKVVGAAIDAGYRLIDTATNYGNETGTGRTLKQTAVPRNQLYVTTKLCNDSQGYDQTLRAFDASAHRLGLEMIDLYLIHWPCPQREAYVDTWRAFIELRKQVRVRSIGVSNFTVDHPERITGDTGVVPAVNQIELHPHFQQRSLREAHERYRIVTEAWSPVPIR